MEHLPEHILNQINEYKPNDKDMKSPISNFLNHLIEFYNDCEFTNHVIISDSTELIYLVNENEPFYKYALRINNREYKILKYNNIPFSDAHVYFKILEDDEEEAYGYAENNVNPLSIPPFIFDDE